MTWMLGVVGMMDGEDVCVFFCAKSNRGEPHHNYVRGDFLDFFAQIPGGNASNLTIFSCNMGWVCSTTN